MGGIIECTVFKVEYPALVQQPLTIKLTKIATIEPNCTHVQLPERSGKLIVGGHVREIDILKRYMTVVCSVVIPSV
jgi:hypothetical protein